MYYFTSESVSPGHPDKLCDHLSDTILDHVLEQDKNSRVACETFVKGKENQPGTVVVGGEITTKGNLNVDELIRKTILEIGYDSNELGFNGNECEIIKLLTKLAFLYFLKSLIPLIVRITIQIIRKCLMKMSKQPKITHLL